MNMRDMLKRILPEFDKGEEEGSPYSMKELDDKTLLSSIEVSLMNLGDQFKSLLTTDKSVNETIVIITASKDTFVNFRMIAGASMEFARRTTPKGADPLDAAIGTIETLMA
jgi:hypothetical protein